jgi:palmitoyl-protein thioesterase
MELLRLFLLLPLISSHAFLIVPEVAEGQGVDDRGRGEHTQKEVLPLVIWHGLGDSFNSSGINSVGELFNSIYPSAYVHSIQLSPTPSGDRTASLFGDINTQLTTVCAQLQSVAALRNGFNAIGFSQGGLFLRGLVQTCKGIKMHTLVTFGSPHNGVAEFGNCNGDHWESWVCAIDPWAPYIQSRVVPAQYFRDPADLSTFWHKSNFLAPINTASQVYKARLLSLERLVLVLFLDDETLRPKESAWFAHSATVPLQQSDLWNEDWLGLRALDTDGRLEFLETAGRHMQIATELLQKFFVVYFGPGGKVGSVDATDSAEGIGEFLSLSSLNSELEEL